MRAKSASQPGIETYYAELLDRPENVFNVDETGITKEHSPAKVFCAKGLTPQYITFSRGKNLTIVTSLLHFPRKTLE